MKTKKSESANIEKMRGLFFQSGMVIVLFLVIVLFEYGTVIKSDANFENFGETEFVEEIIPITDPTPPEPQSPVEPKLVVEFFEIKGNDVDITSDLNLYSDEFNMADLFGWGEDTTDEVVDEITDHCDINPEYPGGIKEMYKFLYENISFNQNAISNNVSGRVTVEFVIDKAGRVSDVSVLKGVHSDLDMEVVKAIKRMPDWTPGIKNGQFVNSRYRIPVKFDLIR
jgi:protein TonB